MLSPWPKICEKLGYCVFVAQARGRTDPLLALEPVFEPRSGADALDCVRADAPQGFVDDLLRATPGQLSVRGFGLGLLPPIADDFGLALIAIFGRAPNTSAVNRSKATVPCLLYTSPSPRD